MFCFILGILAKMKEGAENVQTKLQAKAESVGLKAAAEKQGRLKTNTCFLYF